MNSLYFRLIGRCVVLVSLMLVGVIDSYPETEPPYEAPVSGVDHIALAVADLDIAGERYRQLGFTLKQGRPHANGIRNLHAKFSDGTEIELIAVEEARDALTAEYRDHLVEGEGPAFVALFAPDMDDLTPHLVEEGFAVQRHGKHVSFFEEDSLRYLFFGPRNHSHTDAPEHFDHANGTEALIGVWISGDDLSAERRLLATLGADITREEVHAPHRTSVMVARFPQAEVLLMPGSLQAVPGRKIVGATLRVDGLEDFRQALTMSGLEVPPVQRTKHGRSMFLPPEITHGIWLEFRE